MIRRPGLAALLAGLILLAGCSGGPAEPSSSSAGPTNPSGAVVTVAPKEAAQAPKAADAYDTSQGSAHPDTAVPNGEIPVTPPEAEQQQIIAEGFGGPAIKYVSASPRAPPNRFTSQQAVAVLLAEAAHPSGIDWQNRCEGSVGWAYGWGSSGEFSARTHALSVPASMRHPIGSYAAIPAGALVYYLDPPYGHAMVATGNGFVSSNDVLVRGRLSIVPLSLIASTWFGGRKPAFWTEPWFPKASGSSGVKPPVITPQSNAPAGFPIKPGDTRKRITVLKRHFRWPNTSPGYGRAFTARVQRWEANHHRPVDGIIGQAQYKAMLK